MKQDFSSLESSLSRFTLRCDDGHVNSKTICSSHKETYQECKIAGIWLARSQCSRRWGQIEVFQHLLLSGKAGRSSCSWLLAGERGGGRGGLFFYSLGLQIAFGVWKWGCCWVVQDTALCYTEYNHRMYCILHLITTLCDYCYLSSPTEGITDWYYWNTGDHSSPVLWSSSLRIVLE